MYHTHFNDMRQQYGGLVGPLVVLEPGERWDAARELLVMVSDGPHAILRVNGSASPPPRVLRVGTTYLIRAADIAAFYRYPGCQSGLWVSYSAADGSGPGGAWSEPWASATGEPLG